MIDTTNKPLQQVSNEIAAALTNQGKRCVNSDDECVYQDSEGNHCAIGFLLEPNSDPIFNVTDLCDILLDFDEDEIGVNSGFIRENYNALSHIQSIHDTTHNQRAIECTEILEGLYEINMSAWSEWIEDMPN